VKRVACHGLLDNTVFMFTSDNGFKLGNHNIPREKFTWWGAYERLRGRVGGEHMGAFFTFRGFCPLPL
jgi:hypothetical protein